MGFPQELRSGSIAGAVLIFLEGLTDFAFKELAKIWNVDQEVRKLQRAASRIMAMIECVEAVNWSCFSSENSKKAWELWLEDVKTLSYQAHDLLEDISAELEVNELATEPSPSLCSGILSSGKLNLPREIVKLREMLEAQAGEMDTLLNFEAHKYGNTTKLVTTCSGSTSLVVQSLVVGRDIQKAHIVAKLLLDTNRRLSSISIVGMGGLGKTTFAQLLYNDRQVKRHFRRRIWVSVPRDFDVTRVTRSIIESTTQRSCTLMDLQSLQMRLKQLLSVQRFLLILDDLWIENYSDWEVFSTPLRFAAQANRVIITTRSRLVSDMVGSNPYLLPFLHDRDCWSLIRQMANVDNNVGAEHAIGLEIAKKCEGLPLAAKVFGSTLKCIHYKHWDSFLKSDLWELTSCRDRVFSSIALSYYDLPNQLKKCFTYCSLFPPNYNFEEKKLVLLWLAEGLIEPMGEKNLTCIGKQYFKDLVGRSFFYSYPKKKKKNVYRMHAFFYRMIQFISSDIYLQMSDDSLTFDSSLQNIRHLSFCCTKLMSDDFAEKFPECKRLRTFLLIRRNDAADVGQSVPYLLDKFDVLRVLDLSEGRITVVPRILTSLKHIRYLDLSGNFFKSLPTEIEELFYLEILKLNGCEELEYLPNSLTELGNLRHLEFYGCRKILNMPLDFAERVNVQTLSTFVVCRDEGYTIVEVNKMRCLRGSLELLRLENVRHPNEILEANLATLLWIEELQLEWVIPPNMTQSSIVLDQIQFHENLMKLKITGYNSLKFPQNWLSFSGLNLKNIHLKACNVCSELPPLGHLQFLESLCIELMPAVVKVETAFFPGFPSLKLLEFRTMTGLRRWSNLVPGCMPSLHVLIVKKCLNLTSLPSLGMLPSLTILKIKKCPSLVSLPERLPISLQKLDVRESTLLEQGYEEAQAAAAEALAAQAEGLEAEEAQVEGPDAEEAAPAALAEGPEAEEAAPAALAEGPEAEEAAPAALAEGPEAEEAAPAVGLAEGPEAEEEAPAVGLAEGPEAEEAAPAALAEGLEAEEEALAAQAEGLEAEEAQVEGPEAEEEAPAALAEGPEAEEAQQAAGALEYWQRAIAIPGLTIVANQPPINEVDPGEI